MLRIPEGKASAMPQIVWFRRSGAATEVSTGFDLALKTWMDGEASAARKLKLFEGRLVAPGLERAGSFNRPMPAGVRLGLAMLLCMGLFSIFLVGRTRSADGQRFQDIALYYRYRG